MKVLELCAVDFTAYHLLRPLGIALREAGYEVTFCCAPGEGLDLLRNEGFGAKAIPFSRDYNAMRHARSFAALRSFLAVERFAIVHAHTPVAGLVGRAAALSVRTPVIAYTAHGFYFHEGMSRPVHDAFAALERWAGSFTDVLFVQSEEDAAEAVRLRIAPADRIVHIGNGVDVDRFDRARNATAAAALRARFAPGGGPVVGFVGRTVREKGAIEFVRAAALVAREFPGARFVMVGAPLRSDRDSCEDEIRRLGAELGLGDALVLAGYRRDVPELLASFDVFALPSYREGMPRSLIEAMAAGLPAVATNIRGCREEVVDGVTGALVPPRDHEALAAAIAGVLRSPGRGAAMGAAGRARVLERFDERRVVAVQVERLGRLAARAREK